MHTLRAKLLWLMTGRAAVITLLLGSALLVRLKFPGAFPIDPFFVLIGITYALTAIYSVALKYSEKNRWLVDVQLGCDAVIVSAIVYITNGVSSYFSSLYTLPIIAASTIQSRRGGMMVAVLSSLLYSGLVLAQYYGGFLPGVLDYTLLPPLRMALFTVGLNVFGFLAVAVLSGYLAESARRADERLAATSSQLADLQAFSQHIIDSLMSGLATTDMDGGCSRSIAPPKRSPASRLPRRPAARSSTCCRCPMRWPEMFGPREGRPRLPRVEIAFTRTGYGTIELGLSTALLYTPRGETGFLFTFQDVTESRKVEREARVQQRLAAVGEMAAGIAHEIRNPLASMSGSIQILRQELPLTDEQSQLMDIVLRESDRLNETIRSFLVVRQAAAPQHQPDGREADRHRHGHAAPEQCRADRWTSDRGECSARPGLVCRRPEPDPPGGVEPRDQWPSRDAERRALRLSVSRREQDEKAPGEMIDPRRGSGSGHRTGGARRHLSAIPRRVRTRHRPRAGDRPSHRQRLRRRSSCHVRHEASGPAST